MSFYPNLRTAFGLAIGLFSVGISSHVSAQENMGPSTVEETYQDWILSCQQIQAQQDQPAQQLCEMRQELRQAESNQLVLAAVLQTQAEGSNADLTLVAPFGLLLSEPISLEVNEDLSADVPYRTCLPRGCVAVTVLDEATMEQFALSAEAQVTMATTSGQSIGVTISLAGFSEAWSRLLEIRDRRQP